MRDWVNLENLAFIAVIVLMLYIILYISGLISLEKEKIDAIASLAILLTFLIIFSQLNVERKHLKILEKRTVPRIEIVEVKRPKVFLVPDNKKNRQVSWKAEEIDKKSLIQNRQKGLFFKMIKIGITLSNPTETIANVFGAEVMFVIKKPKDPKYIPQVFFLEYGRMFTEWNKRISIKPNEEKYTDIVFDFSEPISVEEIEKIKVINTRIISSPFNYETTGVQPFDYYIFLINDYGEQIEEKFFDFIKNLKK